jgi:sugar (pentulose or hexulose) kinase
VVHLACVIAAMSDVEKKKKKLQGLWCFPEDYLKDVDISESWSVDRVLGFVDGVCDKVGISMWMGLKQLRLGQRVEWHLQLYLQREVEDEEFLRMLVSECEGNSVMWSGAIQQITEVWFSLGQLVAHTQGLPVPQGDPKTSFTPNAQNLSTIFFIPYVQIP